MAQKKRNKPRNIPQKPKGVQYREEDGDFKLYKIWREKTAPQPFFITDDLQTMIDEIFDSRERWGFSIDLKALEKFIDKHKPTE